MHCIDQLIHNIIKVQNPTVVGLDPDISQIPECYKQQVRNGGNPFEEIRDLIITYNRDIIDVIKPLVPAVKPQIAFYEKYGSYGFSAFEQTVSYAKSKGLVVIEDGKRNDIGNTARAYAEGHLGTVELLDGTRTAAVDVDFLTVTPFLGSESIAPFLEVCRQEGKGIFVLVKTSNSSSGEIQDVKTAEGVTISQMLAKYIDSQSQEPGVHGYTSIGAVVGATYPEEAAELRKLMPRSFFLVPGYGAQGGSAEDILPCFNEDGLGAIVNSSRGILYTHMTAEERKSCTKEEYLQSVYAAALKMKNEIYGVLKETYTKMKY